MITMQGMRDLAEKQGLVIEDAPPYGSMKCYRVMHPDQHTEMSIRCSKEDHVLSVALKVPRDNVPQDAIRRNAFIMAVLLRAAVPSWKAGYQWLVDNMRNLGRNDRLSHAESGVTISLDKWTRGYIRFMIGGLT